MFTIEELLSYFNRCTEHVDKRDRKKIFEKLSEYLQYWGNMSKDQIEEEFTKAGTFSF
jgi:hypothetical protein